MDSEKRDWSKDIRVGSRDRFAMRGTAGKWKVSWVDFSGNEVLMVPEGGREEWYGSGEDFVGLFELIDESEIFPQNFKPEFVLALKKEFGTYENAVVAFRRSPRDFLKTPNVSKKDWEEFAMTIGKSN